MTIKTMLMLGAVLLSLGVLALPVSPVIAHQPYCEDEDLTPDNAWVIRDPAVSTAFYGTLESDEDVDYFTLGADAGQRVFLSITIPQVEGQENFDPVISVTGPGLDEVALPGRVDPDSASHGLLLESVEATEFYEPFGGQYYWQRQEATVTLPEAGDYWIAVWHPSGDIGHYTFVYGQREVLGGDYGCNSAYWTPVGAEEMNAESRSPSLLESLLGLVSGEQAEPEHDHADHDHDDD